MGVAQPECAFVASGILHAMGMRHAALCVAGPGSTVPPHMARLSKEKLFDTKCVLRFPLQLSSEILLILRRTERADRTGVPSARAVPCSCSVLMKLEISRQILGKFSNIKFHEAVQWEPSCSVRTDGQT